MAETSYLSPRKMHPIDENENMSGHAHLYQNMTDHMTTNAAPFNAKIILRAIKSFIDGFKTPKNPSLLSLLLYIKQLNESVTDLLRYNTANQSNNDCQQILLHLDNFNQNIVSYLNSSREATLNGHGSGTSKSPKNSPQNGSKQAAQPTKPTTKYVEFEDFDRVIKTPDDKNNQYDLSEATFWTEPSALSKESSHTNVASEGKDKEDRDSVNSLAITLIKEDKKRKRDLEKMQREEMKHRNINENFNFFESYYVLKQETNYRLHSQQHYSGRLGLKNISRLQLLRLISNLISRNSEIAISHSLIVQILKAVFFSKLSGKKFESISYVRFKKILNLSSEIEQKTNISFVIYNNIKKYFEKKVATKTKDAEHMYQGKLYIDRKFYIMNDILYGSAEYEQMFKVDDEKATEDEIYDAENYGDIYRIVGSKPPLLFKKIELECFDDLQSVLNEQYGLKIFDPNCQLYFGTEVDFNDDGEEIEYISSRLIMTEYKGSTLAEKIYDYAEDEDHLREYDIGQILYKILLAVQQTHRKNVIHCDLKPDNMIINIYDNDKKDSKESKDKRKKVVINLIDFGYCEVVKGQDFIYQKHLIKGTKGYIAPEIFTKYKYSKKSDLYAIGCIGFEMITGGALPSDYDLNGNYIEEEDENEEDNGQGPQLLDIDIEGILNRENRKRPSDARVSGKLIKFISRLAHYGYDGRYDISNAVTIARKYWSNMKPVKHRTAFF